MSLANFPDFLLNFSVREMNVEEKHFYQFKSFRLDVVERQLLNNNQAVPLAPKIFDVLVALVERVGHLVEKDELLQIVWSDSFVEEANIARIVHTLRKTLGEDDNGNKFIETVAKKGYRFVAEVTEVCETPAPKPNRRQAAAVGSQDGADEQLPSAFRQLETKTNPPATAGSSNLIQKPKTRIILFAVGCVSAVSLIFLLSFNFQSKSSVKANDVKSIAVLPLKPLTAENRDAIYELGITDSLINKLSSAKDLLVRPLSATRQYVGIEQDAIAAGREQQVNYVLASNYQILGGKIRITSQLINVQSGQVEEVFQDERENSGIFAVQDALAANIGNSLLKRLNRETNNTTAKHYTTNEEAYRLYLQGAALAEKLNRADAKKAIEYFEQAVKLDPNYAPAYAGLANVHSAVAFMGGGGNSTEQYLKAKTAVEKALAIDDNLAEAHSYLGEIKVNFEWDFAGAEREHRKAVELNPNSAAAHRIYALLLGFLGRDNEAIAEIKTAIDLEPASGLNHSIYGEILFFARRYDDAIRELERTAEMDPEFYFAYRWLSYSYRLKGSDDQAFESFVKAQILAGEEPDEINLWKTIYAKSGWRGISGRQLEKAKADEKKGNPNYNQLAFFSIELGQRDEAFAYLEKAIVQRPMAMIMLNANPRYDSLRADPRFDDLIKRVGLK